MNNSVPELDIQIIGMNPVGQESGNAEVSEGRDIPWLQDVDSDDDGNSDNWLEAWDAVYRDVVILDENGVVADTYNLTINSLEEPQSYNTLRQMLIDIATNAIEASDDSVAIVSNATADIDVLANDEGSSRLELSSLTQPEQGTAEIVTIEYPAHLDPTHWTTTELLISEIVPHEYIEVFNTSFTDSIDLGAISQVLVSGDFEVGVASLSNEILAARSYQQFAWPDGLEMSSASGELILYRTGAHGFDNGANIDDFVAWGSEIENSRIDLARQFGKWDGEADGTLDLEAIQRIPGTIGNEPHSYDNHRPSTPGNAINDAVEVQQVIRYTPTEDFVGQVELSYTVVDDSGASDSATVRINVSPDANPWQNPDNKLDVNNDGAVTTADAQAIIDVLNAGVSGTLPAQIVMPFGPTPFVDCNGNDSVEPKDVLLIVSHLLQSGEQTNAQGEPTEGSNDTPLNSTPLNSTSLNSDSWNDGQSIDQTSILPIYVHALMSDNDSDETEFWVS